MSLPFPSSRLRFLLVSLVLLPGCPVIGHAQPRAFIFVGLAAEETQAARLDAHVRTLRTGFIGRGIPADAITVLGGSSERVRRDQILAALTPALNPTGDATAKETAADDTWLVLLGSANTRSGEPSFQIAGPRLTATDFADAVNALPGRKFVVVATSASGGFLPPLLALSDVEAVSATAEAGEVNEPRFAEAWADSLVATPNATFAELAIAAAARVKTFYESNALAQGEHARLIDRGLGQILPAPFTNTTALAATPPPPAADTRKAETGFAVADIKIPTPANHTEIERRPATDDTRALIAEARAAAADIAHAAIFLRVDTELTIGRDFGVLERHRTRAFLRTGESLDDLGTLWLPSHPPDLLTRLEAVRVITPDGSEVLVNPRSFDDRRAADLKETDDARAQGRPDGPTAPPFLPLPDITVGCIVEAAWTVERRSSQELPEFSQEWSLAKNYPVRALHLSVTTPNEDRWRTFAPNLPESASSANDPSTRTSRWTLADLPAVEPRAGDPPVRRFAPWVGVSSLASWDAFSAWFQRLAAGSNQTGPAVAALAQEITRAHPDRAGRLRAAYERVSSLRYIPIELGVGAFRPRTPEQVWTQRYGDCKDKANLLAAVLGQLGIPAEFALVNRFDHTFTGWPAWQFNHALVRVPASSDAGQPHDLWLDTTDRLVPFGIIAPGNLGRDAFAFNAQGVGAFHDITGVQEPKSEWSEILRLKAEASTWELRLTARGSAEVALRRLFANMPAASRSERLQAMLALHDSSVTRVIAGDPYDLGSPFLVTITGEGSREAFDRHPLRTLIPGLEFFRARQVHRTQPLWWDDGRSWTLLRGRDDARTTYEIPGYVPPPAPGAETAPIMIP